MVVDGNGIQLYQPLTIGAGFGRFCLTGESHSDLGIGRGPTPNGIRLFLLEFPVGEIGQAGDQLRLGYRVVVGRARHEHALEEHDAVLGKVVGFFALADRSTQMSRI